MKKTLYSILSLLFAVCLNAQVASWALKSSPGYNLSAREDAGMVSLNNKLYILGGYDGCGPKDFTEYNPSTGVLKKLANLGVGCANPIDRACLFSVLGKIYSFSGNGVNVYDTLLNAWTYLGFAPDPDAGFVINDTIFIISRTNNNFYSFNVTTNSFTPRANTPATNNGRYGFTFDINGKGYWGAGRTYQTNACTNETGCFTNSFYEYDPITNVWAAKASLPIPFVAGIGISYNGKGYAGLGEYNVTASNTTTKSQFFYEYNPLLNLWQPKQNFMNAAPTSTNIPYSVFNSAIAKIGGDLYVFGGSRENNQRKTDNLYKYSISNDVWQLSNNELGTNRSVASGFHSNGKIYFGGGEDSEALRDFWEYNLTTDQWIAKPSFSSSHAQRASVELNGKGYFIGGYTPLIVNTATVASGNQQYIDSLLEYNPSNNQWTAKPSFPAGGRANMVAVNYNGKIYAGFGQNYNGGWTVDFHMYDPIANNWQPKTAPSIVGPSNNLGHFVIGDTAYVIIYNYNYYIYKYSFLSDNWTFSALPNTIANFVPGNTNKAFSYNNKGYLVYGAYNDGDHLAEYDAATGNWTTILNLPFKSSSQSIIPTTNSVFLGFGEMGVNSPLGILRSNEWHELKFNSQVSRKKGLYESTVSNVYVNPVICGTGPLNQGASHTIYDSIGNLFVAVKSATALISSVCLEVNSIDTLQPYRSYYGNFGKSYNETGTFLNKSVLIKSSIIYLDGKLVLYYTTSELNKFVQNFNTQFGTNKTIDSIKIIRYNNALNDHDPLNNTGASIKLYNPTISNYGLDRAFEIIGSSGNEIYGELYAVLTFSTITTAVVQNITEYSNVFVYPNPTSGAVKIELGILKETELMVFNLTGQKLFTKTINDKTSTIDLSYLSNGVYYLSLKNESSVTTKKIILNK